MLEESESIGKTEGNQELTAVDKCLATTPNIKVRT
jgi:hypothetical protein